MSDTTRAPDSEPLPPPPGPRELPSSLRDALRSGVVDSRVHEEVCAYVDTARRAGDPVERVIIDLKREMHGTGILDRYVRPAERDIAESVIRWCIERYYGAAGRGD
jgi:hypothetical protein